MRTFILRARKGTTRWERIKTSIGTDAHLEVVAHTVLNAFFLSNDFRRDVDVYIVLDSADDFPRTIHFSAADGLSLAGFHEMAVADALETALKNSTQLKKDEKVQVSPGMIVYGYGFEKLVQSLMPERTLYLLTPKGESIKTVTMAPDPVFILTDHLAMPKNMVKSLERRGLRTISLGKTMLFAAQCVTILHYELDGQ